MEQLVFTFNSKNLADYAQRDSDTPVASDAYWNGAADWEQACTEECTKECVDCQDKCTEECTCTFQKCDTIFGTSELPKSARNFRIIEAWEDTLELAKGARALKCCFPAVVEFSVRAGDQWVVLGDAVGFLHNVTTNADGACRKSCDPNEALLNSRVREAPQDEPVPDDDPLAFKNPFFRFAINQPPPRPPQTCPCLNDVHNYCLYPEALPGCTMHEPDSGYCDRNGDGDFSDASDADKKKGESEYQDSCAGERDMTFSFTTQGHFSPLSINTATGDLEVQPTRATYLPTTGELVISDGTIEGITFLDLRVLTVTRQYY